MDVVDRFILFFLITALIPIIAATVTGDQQTWTNANNDTLYNGPDKPTQVTFTTCTKILSITTNHWNFGQGDTPGKISLAHSDGTVYGPWRAFGVNGSGGEENVYWSYNPREEIKAGTYLVSDTNPLTWAQNDASDNRGISTIVFESSPCHDQTEGTINNTSSFVQPTATVPPEMEDPITLSPGAIDPSTLTGGENETEIVPVIEQVVFRLLSGEIHGGDPVYALLRIRNSGFRELKDGYITIRLVNPTGITSYLSGMAKLPSITAGEERDIYLIIPTTKPDIKGIIPGGDSLICGDYILDGTITEHMEGGKLIRRGDLLLPREKMISVTGCCQEPQTNTILRGCRS